VAFEFLHKLKYDIMNIQFYLGFSV